MNKRIAATDAYIAGAQPFARPILAYLRDVVHSACPEAQETIKWRMPFFEYHGLLCYMAAFKAHAAFGFRRHADLARATPLRGLLDRGAMGSFGRLESLDDLPSRRVLTALVKLAMKLADEREKKPAKTAKARTAAGKR